MDEASPGPFMCNLCIKRSGKWERIPCVACGLFSMVFFSSSFSFSIFLLLFIGFALYAQRLYLCTGDWLHVQNERQASMFNRENTQRASEIQYKNKNNEIHKHTPSPHGPIIIPSLFFSGRVFVCLSVSVYLFLSLKPNHLRVSRDTHRDERREREKAHTRREELNRHTNNTNKFITRDARYNKMTEISFSSLHSTHSCVEHWKTMDVWFTFRLWLKCLASADYRVKMVRSVEWICHSNHCDKLETYVTEQFFLLFQFEMANSSDETETKRMLKQVTTSPGRSNFNLN